MVRFLADENFNNDVVRELRKRFPDIHMLRVQDVGLSRAPDPLVLKWAAQHQLVLLTHDVNTVPGYAYARVTAGLPMPGVFAIPDKTEVGKAIDRIVLLAEGSLDGEWENQVRFMPSW